VVRERSYTRSIIHNASIFAPPIEHFAKKLIRLCFCDKRNDRTHPTGVSDAGPYRMTLHGPVSSAPTSYKDILDVMRFKSIFFQRISKKT